MYSAAAWLISLLAAGQASAAPPIGQSLDQLIDFRSAKTCEPGPRFNRLLDSMLRPNGLGSYRQGRPVLPARYRASAGQLRVEYGKSIITATLPMVGTWRSLPVTEVGTWAPVEGDSFGFFIRFNASPEAVRTALNVAGFAIPASGSRNFGELITTAAINPVPAKGGVDFSCGS